MSHKLTIMVSDDVYQGLHAKIGSRKIGRFLEELARPHVVGAALDAAYQQMSTEEAREEEALAWSEGLLGDAGHPAW